MKSVWWFLLLAPACPTAAVFSLTPRPFALNFSKVSDDLLTAYFGEGGSCSCNVLLEQLNKHPRSAESRRFSSEPPSCLRRRQRVNTTTAERVVTCRLKTDTRPPPGGTLKRIGTGATMNHYCSLFQLLLSRDGKAEEEDEEEGSVCRDSSAQGESSASVWTLLTAAVYSNSRDFYSEKLKTSFPAAAGSQLRSLVFSWRNGQFMKRQQHE